MADKPLYYGTGKGQGPLYYGSKGAPAYGGNPAYGGAAYGGAAYGGTAYGGAYGRAYGGTSGGGGGGDDGSIVGTISVGRMLRVISQRWLSVFVFLLVGLVIAFAVYRISPTIYEATSEFTMDMRRSSGGRGGGALAEATPDFGSSYGEIFNTRLSDWRSDKIVTKVVQRYRASHPSSTVSDDEIVGVLGGSRLELQRNSRIITITVRSKVPALAAAIANAYAESIENFTDEENKVRCDKAVAQIHTNVEKRRHEVDKIAKQIMDFRVANKVDNMRSMRDTVSSSLSKATGDILAFETQEAQLLEWEKMLVKVQKEPMTFGTLASSIPRAEAIASEFRIFQDATGDYEGVLVNVTEKHPEAVAKKQKLELAKQRFLAAVQRALDSARADLQIVRNQLTNLRPKQEDLRNELATIEQRIVLAESGLGQLEAEFGVANRVMEGLILNENQARLEAEGNNEIVRVGRPASVPGAPVLPNPMMIFGAGIVVSLALGVLFVLVLDNFEDTVVALSDIEGRLALKVLAVLPHVRRKQREQVAKFVMEDKYAQFSEAVAGLRNLLDSPRYEALSRCMLIISTQPGEGKTITSCSIATSYAQAGRKTLLVDFDLRRPRQAKVWGLELTQDRSFSHVLQGAGEEGAEQVDFANLVNPTGVPGLNVIASLPPEGVSPSTIFGSSQIAAFFAWARAHYDRIIVDSPPYGLVGDVVSLAMMVDSAIIMCCPDRTHFRPIQYCVRCLTEAGANILGVIVNDVEVANAAAFSPSQHHKYGYKYGYGYGYGLYGYGDRAARVKKSGEAAKLLSDNRTDAEKAADAKGADGKDAGKKDAGKKGGGNSRHGSHGGSEYADDE